MWGGMKLLRPPFFYSRGLHTMEEEKMGPAENGGWGGERRGVTYLGVGGWEWVRSGWWCGRRWLQERGGGVGGSVPGVPYSCSVPDWDRVWVARPAGCSLVLSSFERAAASASWRSAEAEGGRVVCNTPPQPLKHAELLDCCGSYSSAPVCGCCCRRDGGGSSWLVFDWAGRLQVSDGRGVR